MKNKLADLNDHLFAEIERLSDESLKGDALSDEINRAKAITDVGKTIVQNAALELSVARLKIEYKGYATGDIPKQISGE